MKVRDGMARRRFRRLSVGLGLSLIIAGAPAFRDLLPTVSAASPSKPAPSATPSPVTPPTRLFGSSSGTTATVAPAIATTTSPRPGFSDSIAIGGLTRPTAIRFASDGSVFVAEKSGLVKRFATLTSTTFTTVADLRTQVDDYWDRGLLGFTLDPNYPTSPYAYVLYTFDAPIGGTAPVWNDACPTPPGPNTDGCVVSGRLSRLNTSTGVEQVLINDWCQQFPSHSVGDLRFGTDGALYATAGEGASFNGVDYGQFGGTQVGTPTPANPCGDPPSGVGGTQTAPTAEGGALRPQSLRRPSTEPVVLSGTVIRIDPATGAALSTNPLAGSPDANARRIVGYGLRNPFRFAIRPGSNELWIANVGWGTWESIDRVANPLATPVANFGWPCYEGPAIQGNYQATNLALCQSLYTAGTWTPPYYSYNHSTAVVAGETCPTGSSSITGMTFYTGGSYPAAYTGALFFADHSRDCIWAMLPGSNGLPDRTTIQTFVAGAANPVDLEIGPAGDLFYVDFEGGAIHRVTVQGSAPTAVISADRTAGALPLTINFDGTGSTDPNQGGTLSYSWDLNGDGIYGDSTSPTPSYTYTTAATVTVGLKVTDSVTSRVGTATIQVTPGAAPPTPTIDTPASSFTWAVGDLIAFSGHAIDGSSNPIPASGLSWALIIHHCPSNCHTHLVQTFAGVASGSVAAPDHEYPSYLELRLTATDSAGNQASTSVRLDPKTVVLSFASVPSGLSLAVGTTPATATPFTTTEIQNSAITMSAPDSQILNGTTYAYASWSDGGVQGHTVIASASATYSATYTAVASQVRVETAADGSGLVVPAQSLASGTSRTVYAISRGAGGAFVANVAATWSLGAIGGGVVASDLAPSGDGKSATITGHAAGSAVIHAVSGSLTPGDSGTITVRSVPSAPSAVQAFPGDRAASVTFAAPSSDGGSPITGYTATSNPAGRTCSTSGALSCTISGLVNGASYTFTVTATSAVGTGPASSPSAAVVPQSTAASFVALSPARILDSRVGTGLGGSFSSGVARTFEVANHGGVPSTAIAVTGNLTVTGQTALGYVFLGPTPTNNPTSSTLNFPLGDDRANGITVALGTYGTLSATYIATPGQTTNLVFDVTGYFLP